MPKSIWSVGAASVSLACGVVAIAEPPPVALDGRGVAALVERDRLLADLKALPTKRSPNGSKEHGEGLRATEELIIARLKQLGYEPTLQDVDFLGSSREARQADGDKSAPWRNIIIDLPGTTRPNEIIVIGAHFDAVVASPGADDNGTGTVVLLEAARVLKDRPMQRTVRLAFFNLEEVGLVGSRAYVDWIMPQMQGPAETPPSGAAETTPDAAAPTESTPISTPASADTPRLMGMVSIDGVGYFTDEPDSQKSPIPPSPIFTPPTVGDFLALGGIARYRYFSQPLVKAMQRSAPDLKIVAADFVPVALPDLLRSDHAPFMAKGVPAVILADTANFRSPHYHQPTDTVDTIDMARFTLVAQAIIGATYELAGPVGGDGATGKLPRLLPPDKPKTAPTAESTPAGK